MAQVGPRCAPGPHTGRQGVGGSPKAEGSAERVQESLPAVNSSVLYFDGETMWSSWFKSYWKCLRICSCEKYSIKKREAN